MPESLTLAVLRNQRSVLVDLMLDQKRRIAELEATNELLTQRNIELLETIHEMGKRTA